MDRSIQPSNAAPAESSGAHELSAAEIKNNKTSGGNVAFHNFTIGLVISMLGIVYFGGTLPANNDTAVKVATSAGTVVGQLGFGVLADIVGRKKMVGSMPSVG